MQPQGLKDTGQVMMKAAMVRLGAQAGGKLVSTLARQRL
ncbi:hypothetical protein DFAR_3800052 [Desulfarculales bacterium]